jgi:hypothetical protein
MDPFALGCRGIEYLRSDDLFRRDDLNRRSPDLGKLRRPSAGQPRAKRKPITAAGYALILRPLHQLRQLGNVRLDAPRFVFGQSAG